MAGTPLRGTAVAGAHCGGGTVGAASTAGPVGTERVRDVFASADYRRHLAPIVVRRALEEAMTRA